MTVILGDRFQLLECLGKGGMAEVYRARDRRLGRDVAIKLLNAACSRDPGLIERFRKESNALAQLSHPRIVTLLDTGETYDGRFFLVMERLQGEGLDAVFHGLRCRGEVMPWSRLAGIVRQVCSALQAAHARHIIHRDIKPSNLFRLEESPEGEDFVKILDFGIAKILASVESGLPDDKVHLTASGMFVGTPHYAAPEAIEPNMYGCIGPQVDVYALGIILYQGVVGTLPYDGEPRSKILYKTVFEEPPPLCERANRPVPPSIEALVMRALARDPAQRFTSVRELSEALAAVPEREAHALDRCKSGKAPTRGGPGEDTAMRSDGRRAALWTPTGFAPVATPPAAVPPPVASPVLEPAAVASAQLERPGIPASQEFVPFAGSRARENRPAGTARSVRAQASQGDSRLSKAETCGSVLWTASRPEQVSGTIEDPGVPAGSTESGEPAASDESPTTSRVRAPGEGVEATLPGSSERQEEHPGSSLGMIVLALILLGVIVVAWWFMPEPHPERPRVDASSPIVAGDDE